MKIKSLKQGSIRLKSIVPFVKNIKKNISNNYVPVLIIDEGRLTNEVKEYLNKENIIVLDKKLIERF